MSNEKVAQIRRLIEELYPDATSVNVFVNYEDIEITPRFKTNLDGFSMRTITGVWLPKKEAR